MGDPLLDALQSRVSEDSPGWAVTLYVAVVGLQRLDSNGDVESGIEVYSLNGQHPVSTDGLFNWGQEKYQEALAAAETDDED